jgi:hypothetical protein
MLDMSGRCHVPLFGGILHRPAARASEYPHIDYSRPLHFVLFILFRALSTDDVMPHIVRVILVVL